VFHHDQREYGAAVDEAGKKFKGILEGQIHAAQHSAMDVIEKVTNEVPVDRVVHTRALTFALQEQEPVEGSDIILPPSIYVGTKDKRFKGHFMEGMHKHALTQVAERAGIPGTYLNRLLAKPYGPELVIENLTTIFQKEEPSKYLFRSVGEQVRGVLSDSFRRMDSRPIIEAFAAECAGIGAVPVEGIGGDLRWSLRAILPMVFQPSTKPGSEEYIAFGLALTNSDFGVGALSLRLFMLRVWCSNMALLNENLRQVHLGKRLADNIEFSQKTYELDTQTQVSAVKDIIRGSLSPDKINESVALIGKALDEKISPKNAWEALPKQGLLKGEVAKVREIFNDGGVEELPPGTTVARLSNAISWFAKEQKPERRIELEAVAGNILMQKAKIPKKKAAVAAA
jgi:hypothetical protein